MTGLRHLPGFLAYLGMAFLNAFTDLGHKIIIQNTLFKVYDGATQILLTTIVNALILLPFVLLLTPAGFLSDRFRRPQVMRICAFTAVLLTLAITLCYYRGWFVAAFAMTLLMAVQSAIYSPAKFGYLRGWAGEQLLSRANAVAQAVSIIAILGGILVFSWLFERFLQGESHADEAALIRQIAPLGWLLVGCALCELALSFRLPDQPASAPDTAFRLGDYLRGRYLAATLGALRRPPVILYAVVLLTLFWGISQVLLATFPAWAKAHLGIDNALVVQALLASSAIGILLGALLSGKLSGHHIEPALIPPGMAGVALCLYALPRLDEVWQVAVCFALTGFFGGIYLVPLNALIQFHAPRDQLGRILAANNWAQNIAMLLFLALTFAVAWQGMDAAGVLMLLLAVAVAGTLLVPLQLPFTLARWLSGWKRHREIDWSILAKADQGILFIAEGAPETWRQIQAALPAPVLFALGTAELPLLDRFLLHRLGAIEGGPASLTRDRARCQALISSKTHVVCFASQPGTTELARLWQASGGRLEKL